MNIKVDWYIYVYEFFQYLKNIDADHAASRVVVENPERLNQTPTILPSAHISSLFAPLVSMLSNDWNLIIKSNIIMHA